MHAAWVVWVGFVYGILKVNSAFRHVNQRLSYQNWFDMVFRDGLFKTSL